MRTNDFQTSLDDTFAMVKDSMAAKNLSQPPLLVMPAAMIGESKAVWQEANLARCPVLVRSIDEQRRGELEAIHRAMSRDFPHMRWAIGFYAGMISGDATLQRVPDLSC